MHLWQSKYGPFIQWAQLDFCRRLVVVPLSSFHRLAELIGDPHGELILLNYSVRSGSTLLTQVVHRIISRKLLTNKNPLDSKLSKTKMVSVFLACNVSNNVYAVCDKLRTCLREYTCK